MDSEEKSSLAPELKACMSWGVKEDAFRAENWFKVDHSFYVRRGRERKLISLRYLGILYLTLLAAEKST